MTKWSGVPQNNSPALADFLMGVTAGNIDDRKTIQAVLTLINSTSIVNNGAIDWSTAGKVWWQELGRATLTANGNALTIASFTPRKYMRLLLVGQGTGGTVDATLRFNNDSGANYSRRENSNGAASDTVSVSQTSHLITGAATYNNLLFVADITNVATLEKVFNGWRSDPGTAGGANAPGRQEVAGKWANTASAINRVDILNLTGTGQYAIGSEIIVLGHD